MAAVLLVSLFATLVPGPAPLRAVCAYAVLMILPGLSLGLFVFRRESRLKIVASALVVSPVVSTLLFTLLLLAGVKTDASLRILAAAFAAAGIASALVKGERPKRILDRSQAMVLAVFTAALLLFVGYLPLTSEWWRTFSDAWFHAAIVHQIDGFGIPPEDPYFAGFPLQYMWLYHVLVYILWKATSIEPFKVMPLINLHALVIFVLASFLCSLRLRRGKGTFEHGFSSVLLAVFGLNAVFWAFFPLKLLRAFTGSVRGMAEITNIFSLSPLNIITVRKFLEVYNNQVFFLDKFIVSTPFSLGLAFMAAFWLGVVGFLSGGGKKDLVPAGAALLGLLAFHPAVGFIMLVGLYGGSMALFAWPRKAEDYSKARIWTLLALGTAALAAMSPYLYEIMRYKEKDNVIPLGVSLAKTGGILISCALALFLAAFQAKRLRADRFSAHLYLVFATAAITAFCLVINLPGPNTFDKFPFFVFYPLAVVGGWTLADYYLDAKSSPSGRTRAIVMLLLLLAPANIIAAVGYYRTPSVRAERGTEKLLATWIRENTPRDALIIDSGDRVSLLVEGPRRYYWGIDYYARLWGYDRVEMQRRRHVRDVLFSKGDIDSATFEALAAIEEEVYVVVREGEAKMKTDTMLRRRLVDSAGRDKFDRYPSIFTAVYSAGETTLYKVNKSACVRAAGATSNEKTGSND